MRHIPLTNMRQLSYENRVEHIPDDCKITWPSCTLKEADQKAKSVDLEANGSARLQPCTADTNLLGIGDR
jgi:hypothetical protein